MSWRRAFCFFKRNHLWRKARVKEDASKKFCTRCGASVAVRKRKETPDVVVANSTATGRGTV